MFSRRRSRRSRYSRVRGRRVISLGRRIRRLSIGRRF